MSSYTTTLRRLLDPEANTAGYSFVKGHYVNGQWISAHLYPVRQSSGLSGH